MNKYVFKFIGPPASQADALTDLRTQLPDTSRITPKTSSLVEVLMDGDPSEPAQYGGSDEAMRRLHSQWEISPASYAEIKQPRFVWDQIRDKLGT